MIHWKIFIFPLQTLPSQRSRMPLQKRPQKDSKKLVFNYWIAMWIVWNCLSVSHICWHLAIKFIIWLNLNWIYRFIWLCAKKYRFCFIIFLFNYSLLLETCILRDNYIFRLEKSKRYSKSNKKVFYSVSKKLYLSEC